MADPTRITYLFESTMLWGGTKVALEQAEALSEAGYEVTVLSKDSGPTWYPLKLPVLSVPELDASTIPQSDIIVGTYWPTVKAAYLSGKGTTVHLCQGYEGGNIELLHQKPLIDEVYAYKIPKLTVSPHLDKFLHERFASETYYIGQMINREIFYPSEGHLPLRNSTSFAILVVGPFEADVKNIRTTLKGISMAKSRLPLRVVRVSQFPLSKDEKDILKPDEYHFHISYPLMGSFYRNADLLISMSKEAEGFGLPPLEAMASGIPTILSKVPSHLSYDEPADYAVFVAPNPEQLCKAIVTICTDREMRDRLSKRGLSVAEKFNKESVLLRLVRAFKDITSRSWSYRRT
jgi:glycosyltransferase involved in cell wall biosynthesis